jgi:hypothetical protein
MGRHCLVLDYGSFVEETEFQGGTPTHPENLQKNPITSEEAVRSDDANRQLFLIRFRTLIRAQCANIHGLATAGFATSPSFMMKLKGLGTYSVITPMMSTVAPAAGGCSMGFAMVTCRSALLACWFSSVIAA